VAGAALASGAGVTANRRLTATAGAALLAVIVAQVAVRPLPRRGPAYVREGPPPPALRTLATLLVASTVAVIGSGFALMVNGPARAGPLVTLHVISFLVWMPAIAIHLRVYVPQVPRLVAKDCTRGSVTLAASTTSRPHREGATRVPECEGASVSGFQIPCGQDPVGNGSGNRGRGQAARAGAGSGSVQYGRNIESCDEIDVLRMGVGSSDMKIQGTLATAA